MTTLLREVHKDVALTVNKDVLINRNHLWNVAYKLRIQTDVQDSRFTPAEHYFDNQDNEIALIYCPKTYKEEIIVFDQPRTWPQEIKDMHTTTILREAQKIPQRKAPEMSIIAELQEEQVQPQTQPQLYERSNVNIQQRGKQMTSDKEMEDFWHQCPENFAHTKIYGHLKDVDNLTAIWDNSFINTLNDIHPIKDNVIVDYGIGGAFLGLHLHKQFGLKKYIGIDIAKRQLEEAYINISRMNHGSHRLDPLHQHLIKAGCDFNSLYADIFITQACMQHFPSIEYLNDFLDNVNSSNIKTIVLQFRNADETYIANDSYEKVIDVCFKSYTNADYVSEKMTNYALSWLGDIHGLTDDQYTIFQRI